MSASNSNQFYDELEYETTEELDLLVEEENHSSVVGKGIEIRHPIIEPESNCHNNPKINSNNKMLISTGGQSSRTTRSSSSAGGAKKTVLLGGNVRGITVQQTDPEFVLKFIRRVKSMPLLYNQDDENFRNIHLKQQGWRLIAQEFGHDAKWCMKKWVSLRDYFVKRKKLLRMGHAARPWMYYNEMRFLNVIYGHDRLDFYPTDNISVTRSGSNDEHSSSSTLHNDEVQIYSKTPLLSVKMSTEDFDQEEEQQYEYEDEQADAEDDENHEDSLHDGPVININPFPSKTCTLKTYANSKKRKMNTSATTTTEVENHDKEDDNGYVNCIEDDSRSSWNTNYNSRSNTCYSKIQSQDTYELFCLSVAAQMRNMSRNKALGLQVKIMKLIYEFEFPDKSQH